jgi:hypothetical protein
VIQGHLNTTPDSPSTRLGRPLPTKLERLVLDCLEKTRLAVPGPPRP